MKKFLSLLLAALLVFALLVPASAADKPLSGTSTSASVASAETCFIVPAANYFYPAVQQGQTIEIPFFCNGGDSWFHGAVLVLDQNEDSCGADLWELPDTDTLETHIFSFDTTDLAPGVYTLCWYLSNGVGDPLTDIMTCDLYVMEDPVELGACLFYPIDRTDGFNADTVSDVIHVNDTQEYALIFYPYNTTISRDITYVSTNPDVATVTNDIGYAKVTGISEGTTIIQAQDRDGNPIAVLYLAVGCFSSRYSDVAADVWYHKAVDYVTLMQAMRGIDDSNFSPETYVTRAQLVAALYQFEGSPGNTYEGTRFSDVQNSETWFYDAIYWAAENGVIHGYEDGSFQPDREISRQEMMTVIYNYACNYCGLDEWFLPGDPEILAQFPDGNTTWAKDAFSWAIENQIINGKDGLLAPTSTTRRCELAQVLMKLLSQFP